MDILLDLAKDDAFMSEQCCGCKREDVTLTGCSAANCYAAFCQNCNHKGVFYKSLYVCGMCVSSHSPVGDVFDSAGKAETRYKSELNAVFVEAVLKVRDIAPGPIKVLVLDGAQGQSTYALKAADSSISVIVPNPDDKVCLHLAQSGADARKMRLGAFLTQTRRENNARVSCAWLDYCCTYDGSRATQVFPREDLWKLWHSGLNDDRGVVAVAMTFCMRASLVSPEDIVAEQIATSALYNWITTSTRVVRYRTMAFFLFHARRPCEVRLENITEPEAEKLLRAIKARRLVESYRL
jgi:hypothetical protein